MPDQQERKNVMGYSRAAVQFEDRERLTCMNGILLVQVKVGVDVGVLVVMGSHVEHLQPGQRVIAQGCHPFCMLPFCCQPLSVRHVRT